MHALHPVGQPGHQLVAQVAIVKPIPSWNFEGLKCSQSSGEGAIESQAESCGEKH